MSETKHTPGPWQTPGIDGSARVVCHQDNSAERRTLAHVYGSTETERDANAQLIAAAPELLEALEKIKTILQYVEIHAANYIHEEVVALDKAATAVYKIAHAVLMRVREEHTQ